MLKWGFGVMFGNAHKLPHKDITVEYGDVWYTVA